jgi:TctA family transporter
MDMIGEDVLCTDFTNLGVTRAATIAKMEPVYSLVMQGMFTEAAALTATLTVDGFFTAAKIAQYQAIIAGADAFAVVL